MKRSGNTVLITGGATGIGYAMAEAFLKEGNEVLICGRREDRLERACKALPALHAKTCDVTKAADRAALLEWVTRHFGRLNVLVNNAGLQRDIDFTKGAAELDAGANEIAVNLEAPIVLSGLFVPQLTGKEGAAIVQVTSGLAFVPAAKMPIYSASKAGLHAFSMALRHQLAGAGIQVFEVVAPAIDTELNPEGRARRGGFKPDLKPEPFVAAVMQDFANDVFEIGFGMTKGMLSASRAELEIAFVRMNSGM
ncbi:MAG TPA: SDR family NAD(P)-dependent oxidoreductase [Polyangiaceae bacterium]|jgi:uncharacterized oxidoreductase